MKKRLTFLIIYGSIVACHLATLFGLAEKRVYKLVETERKRMCRKKHKRVLTAEELKDIEDVRRAIQALAHGTPPSTRPRTEFLMYPQEKESGGHLGRLLGEIAEARKSLDICQYAITHQAIVDAVIAANARLQALKPKSAGPAVRVVVDFLQMRLRGSLVKRLVEAGVPVKVNRRTTFMMHDKYMVFDKTTVAHGSLNWSYHSHVSKEMLVIQKGDQELNDAVAEDFEDMWASEHYVPVTLELLEKLATTRCTRCAARTKAQRQEKQKLKRRAKANVLSLHDALLLPHMETDLGGPSILKARPELIALAQPANPLAFNVLLKK